MNPSRFLLLFCAACSLLAVSCPAECLPSTSPSLYVFGASMVDTGENSVAMPLRSNADFDPYGSDYFGKPTGRWSNGRNFIDLISQGLGFGLLSPFLKSFDSNFTHGINFASSGSTAGNSTAEGEESSGLFALPVQICQFREYKEYVLSLQKTVQKRLELEQHFSNSVYFIEAAQNDYLTAVLPVEEFDSEAIVLTVISAMREALQNLYDLDARTFLVMNVPPFGCAPMVLSNPHRSENRDEYGCKVDYLELAAMHNEHLIQLLNEFRTKYPAAEWILYDAYSIMLDGYHNPSNYGLEYTLEACCGAGGTYNFVYEAQCGQPGTYINGTFVKWEKCEDPSLYLIWDSIHPTESFCQYLAQGVLNGTHLSPEFNILERIQSKNVTKNADLSTV